MVESRGMHERQERSSTWADEGKTWQACRTVPVQVVFCRGACCRAARHWKPYQFSPEQECCRSGGQHSTMSVRHHDDTTGTLKPDFTPLSYGVRL